MPKQLIAKRTVRKASKVLTAMDKKLDRILAVAKVTKNHKKVEAELDKMATDLQKLYAGVKSKIAELEALPQMDRGTAELLEDTAILATKVDLLKSVIAKCKSAEDEGDEEEDGTPVTVDDVLQDLGVEDGGENSDNGNGGEAEDLGNDGVVDEDEAHGELPADFEGDHEDAMDLADDEDAGDDIMIEDDEDDEEDDEGETQAPVTASKKVKATRRKPAVAKRVVKKTIPETSVSGLFDFIGGGK